MSRSCASGVHAFGMAPSCDTNAVKRSTSGSCGFAGRRKNPRPAREQIGAGRVDAADRGAGERMPADETQPRRQVARGRNDGTLGTADVGDERLAANVRRQIVEQADILPDRRCEHDEVGAVREREIVAADVRRSRAPAPPRRLQRDRSRRSEHRGCDLTQRERNRSADQPEAHDGDLLKHAMTMLNARMLNAEVNSEFNSAFRLQHSELLIAPAAAATGSRQMLRPIAGAMIRSSAIRRSNCAGNSDCAPSLSA